MNNNYHTQMDKQNNMLNEVAANNNLLQQQMQNFQGTPINKTVQQTQQLTPQQIMYAQMMQQNQKMVPQGPQGPQSQPFQQTQLQTDDEIDLSDIKPESKPENNSNKPIDKQNQQINKQIQQVLQNNTNSNPNLNPNPIGAQTKPIKAPTLPKKLPIVPYHPLTTGNFPPPAQQNKSQSKLTEYVIMPIVILVAFILIMHPSTSKFFNKFLPSSRSTKGLFVRGLLLAIIYVVARMILNMTSK